MAMSAPKLHARLNTQPDGQMYVAIMRGQLAWIRVNLTEIPDLCDRLIDIYEQENK